MKRPVNHCRSFLSPYPSNKTKSVAPESVATLFPLYIFILTDCRLFIEKPEHFFYYPVGFLRIRNYEIRFYLNTFVLFFEELFSASSYI